MACKKDFLLLTIVSLLLSFIFATDFFSVNLVLAEGAESLDLIVQEDNGISRVCIDNNQLYYFVSLETESKGHLKCVSLSDGTVSTLTTVSSHRFQQFHVLGDTIFGGFGDYGGSTIFKLPIGGTRADLLNIHSGSYIATSQSHIYYFSNWNNIWKNDREGNNQVPVALGSHWVRNQVFDDGIVFFYSYWSHGLYRLDLSTDGVSYMAPVSGDCEVFVDDEYVYTSRGGQLQQINKQVSGSTILANDLNAEYFCSDGDFVYGIRGIYSVVKIPTAGGDFQEIVVSMPGKEIKNLQYSDGALYITARDDTGWSVSSLLVKSLDDGLVAHWSLNEGSGSLINDLTGSGHSGVINGPVWAEGIDGDCLHFDGTQDLVTIDDSPDFNVESTTISAWVKFESFGDDEKIILRDQGAGDPETRLWQMTMFAANEFGVIMSTVNEGTWGIDIRIEADQFFNLDQWHHVVVTYDGMSRGRLFVDGALAGEDDSSGPLLAGAQEIEIGGSSYEPNSWFSLDGAIDEVRIYSRALTSTEILKLYGLNSPLELAQLTGYVVNSETGLPVSNAIVNITPEGTAPSVLTDASGHFSMSLPPGFGYNLEVRSDGFQTKTITDIECVAGIPHELSIAMETIAAEITDFRIRFLSQAPVPAPFDIPKNGTGYWWVIVEGLTGSGWSPVSNVLVEAEDQDGDLYHGRSDYFDYEFLEQEIPIARTGVTGIKIQADKIGSGEIGDYESLRITAVNNIPQVACNLLPVRIAPNGFTKNWGYRLFSQVGFGAGIPVAVKADAFIGGGSGSTITIDYNETGTGFEWDVLRITRQSDLNTKIAVGIAPDPMLPVQIDIGKAGLEAAVKLTIPYASEYVFDLDDLEGIESVLAFYLFAEPYFLFGNGIDGISARVMSKMVQFLIINSGVSELGLHRASETTGGDCEGSLTLEAGFGFNQVSTFRADVGASLGASGHFGTGITKTPEGVLTQLLYEYGSIDGEIGPRFIAKRGKDYARVFNLFNLFENPIPHRFKVESGYDLSRSYDGGIPEHLTLGTWVSSQQNSMPDIQLDGEFKKYRYEIRIDNQDLQSRFLDESQLLQKFHTLGEEDFTLIGSNETFRMNLLTVLDNAQQVQSDNQNATIDYSYQGTGYDEFSLELNYTIPLQFWWDIHFKVGRGISSTKSNSHQLGTGYWVDGRPLLLNESLPSGDGDDLNTIMDTIWDGIKLSAIWDDFVDEVKAAFSKYEIHFFNDGLHKAKMTEFFIGENGSSLIIDPTAFPVGVDSMTCLNWSWVSGVDSQKLNQEQLEKVYSYNKMYRKAREEADGLTYGIGEFYKFSPDSIELLHPAILTICYSDSEVVDFDESSLSVFYQNPSGSWVSIPSVTIPDSNKVRANITTMKTFTLGPRMPQGQYVLVPDVSDLIADGISTVTLTSELLFSNDGVSVENGTLFSVSTTSGTILSIDMDPSQPGIQVPVVDQRISLEYQSGLLPIPVTIAAKSNNGYARCEVTIHLLDADLPSAPVITALTPHWRGFTVEWDPGEDVDISGYLIWYGTDSPGAPYNGTASVWGEDSPVSVGVLDSLVVDGLIPGTTYYVAISALDLSGNQSSYSTEFSVAVSGVETQPLPKVVGLDQNYPNPFNPTTKIRFSLPRSGNVSLKIFDLRGRLVKTLVDGALIAGRHEETWYGDDTVGRSVASGVYLYLLQTEQETRVRKMVVVR